jgi:hypothetical protein
LFLQYQQTVEFQTNVYGLPTASTHEPLFKNVEQIHGSRIANTHYMALHFMELDKRFQCGRDLPSVRNLVFADGSGCQTPQCHIVHQMDIIERIHCHKYCRAIASTVWLIQVSTMIQQQLY